MRRLTARLAAVLVIAAASVTLLSAVALAAPVASNADFTNPVAYELKSLQATRFQCATDVKAWAVLDVFSADGIVKTVYSGPTTGGGALQTFPVWDGKDYLGRRLPTATYEWRLTLNRGGETSVTRGRVIVSRITFAVSAVESSDEGYWDVEDRYMIPGNANVYLRLRPALPNYDKGWGSLNVQLEYPAGVGAGYLLQQVVRVGNYESKGPTLNTTTYLRGANAVRNRGPHTFRLATQNADYYFTVIQ